MVAMYLMIDTGLMAPIRGWLRRADRLIAGHEETPVHAIVAMVRTYERLWCGDMVTAGTNAAQAVELGERFGVPPAVLVGRTAMARLRIFDGHIDEGVEMACRSTSGQLSAQRRDAPPHRAVRSGRRGSARASVRHPVEGAPPVRRAPTSTAARRANGDCHRDR